MRDQKHVEHLKKVFKALRENQLYVKREKCEFAQPKIHFLGHVISQGELRMDEAKLRSFLGLTNYYRRFISGYSGIDAPLTELLKKNRLWLWSEECQEAFEGLKAAVTEEPVLMLPDFTKTFEIHTDASDFSIGGPLENRYGRTTSGMACHHRLWTSRHSQTTSGLTRSDDVGRGMPSSPLGSTDGRKASSVACHNRPWTAQTVSRRRAWHAVIALGQHKRSTVVGRAYTQRSAVGRLQKHIGDVDGSSEAKVGGRQGRPVGLVGVFCGRLMACMAHPYYVVGRLQKHASDVCGAAEAKAGERQGRPVGLVGMLRGHLTACVACPCYAAGRLQKHARDVYRAFVMVAGKRHGRPMGLVGVLRWRLTTCMACPCYAAGRLQKHVSDVCRAFEAVAGGRHGRPLGLVGVLHGRLTTCVACPCYDVGRQQKHASDVCGATEAKEGGRQGCPVGLVGVLCGRLTAWMARLCFAVGRLQKHATDACGETVLRRGNFSRSVYTSVWCGNCSAFEQVASSRAPVTANSRRRTHGARKAMYGHRAVQRRRREPQEDTARRVVYGALSAALENLETECRPCWVVLVTASGLQGKGSVQSGSITSGKGFALRDGHVDPSPKPVVGLLELLPRRERVAACRIGDGQGESHCLIKTKHCDGPKGCLRNVISAQCSECQSEEIQPCAVNGGSNYHSLKVAKCLVIKLVTRMNGLTRFPLCLSTRAGLAESGGKEDPFELDSSPTLSNDLRGVLGTAPHFGPKSRFAGRSRKETLSVGAYGPQGHVSLAKLPQHKCRSDRLEVQFPWSSG
uniref:Reverse transcriptase/retrotransposon-derived protein RNase H-like domain-containing protein n=1 Tax=Solanum lycopersicum TaxID=4081 RepID=A0A3Q7IU85_SOLLC